MKGKKVTKRNLVKIADLNSVVSNTITLKEFESLPVSIASKELFDVVFKEITELKSDSEYAEHWKNQVLRSASTIYANLAEGYGRSGIAARIWFLRIAKGSAFETMAHFRTGPVRIQSSTRKKCRILCSHIQDVIQEAVDAEASRILEGGKVEYEA